ncbi:MAG TPA: glycosyltransferase [Rubricoccaceae bacterium]
MTALDAFVPLLVATLGGYTAFAAALAWRTSRTPVLAPPLPDDRLPTLAIVVAARDEEACIGRCLDALLAQDYPADRLEIVVADDGSTDRTGAIVQSRILRPLALAGSNADDAAPHAGRPDSGRPERDDPPGGPRLRLVRVPEAVGRLHGKAHALHTAIETTRAEIVLVTDADCAAPPLWARATAAPFADPAVGLVCGFARIDPRPGHAFDRVQALDWTLLIGAVSALAEAGVPATGMGNNMAVRRATYDAIGGYPALPFSVTEDFTLVRAVAERTQARVRFPVGAPTTVWTLPVDGFAAAYRQRRRWARGGLAGGLPVVAAYVGLWLVHVLPLVGLVLAPGVTLACVAAKTLADGLLLTAVLRRVGGRVRWADVLGLEAFLFAYLVTLPVALVLWPRIGWKGRSL